MKTKSSKTYSIRSFEMILSRSGFRREISTFLHDKITASRLIGFVEKLLLLQLLATRVVIFIRCIQNVYYTSMYCIVTILSRFCL
jgi:hypothetical protein